MTKWAEKNGIEFWTMPPERAEEALDVLRNGFFEDELFCLNSGVADDPDGQSELEKLAVETAHDGVSVMALDKVSGNIVGVCYNKIQVEPPPGESSFFEKFRDTKCKSKSAITLINKMLSFDSYVNLFEKYNTKIALELMFLGTHRDYRRRGAAVGMVEASLRLGRVINEKPPIATAIFSSPFSIRTGRILHFDEVIAVPVNQIKLDEESKESFADHPKVEKDHPGAIVMAKRLHSI